MEHRTILPVSYQIPQKSDMYTAQRLSILYANTVNAPYLVYNKYIQLIYRPFRGGEGPGVDDRITFYTDVPLIWGGLDSDFYDDKVTPREMLGIVKEELEQGNFVFVFLNNHYIASCSIGRDFDHEYLIYGYDDVAGILHTAMFSNRDRYEAVTMTYKEFLQAFETRTMATFEYIITQCERGYDHKADDNPQRVRLLLKDYLRSENSVDWLLGRDICEFGCQVYDSLWEKTLSYQKRTKERVLDIRDYSVIAEHKTMLYDLIKTYLGLERAAQEYEEIVTTAQVMKMLAMECYYRNSDRYFSRIKQKLDTLKRREPELLEKIL